MYQENIIDMLMRKMIHFNQNDPQRIHHLIKVHSFAQMIGRMEQLDGHSQFLTECAALVHDIGIRPAEEKYGMSSGRLQEQEGPFYARKMLGELGFEEADINRICYLVGHHHTYADIDGIDYQILVEADFLVNFYELFCFSKNERSILPVAAIFLLFFYSSCLICVGRKNTVQTLLFRSLRKYGYGR